MKKYKLIGEQFKAKVLSEKGFMSLDELIENLISLKKFLKDCKTIKRLHKFDHNVDKVKLIVYDTLLDKSYEAFLDTYCILNNTLTLIAESENPFKEDEIK